MAGNRVTIKNEYNVTWKKYLEWWLESKGKPPRSIIAIMWIVLGFVSAGIGIVCGFGFFLCLVLVLFCIYRAAPRDLLVLNRQYKSMAKSFGQKEWLRTIVFEEEEITVLEGNITMNFKYSDISGVKEKDNKVWLMLRDKRVIRMYKDSFKDSNWEECSSLIKRKCSAP